MARRTADELAGTRLSLVYIADNLVDARKAERVLTEQGIEYAISLEPFASTSVMLVGARTGLFVYVPVERHEACRMMLQQNGLGDTVGLEDGLTVEKLNGT